MDAWVATRICIHALALFASRLAPAPRFHRPRHAPDPAAAPGLTQPRCSCDAPCQLRHSLLLLFLSMSDTSCPASPSPSCVLPIPCFAWSCGGSVVYVRV
uniref:Uncharacterized protein n=1 Tax=Arundo donax TaxID=35708 RepID=A0A0A9HBB8_ARUDO